MLTLESRDSLRRRVMQAFAHRPQTFARMLALHVGAVTPLALAGIGLSLGWDAVTQMKNLTRFAVLIAAILGLMGTTLAQVHRARNRFEICPGENHGQFHFGRYSPHRARGVRRQTRCGPL